MKRKIIQIVAVPASQNHDSILYALTDDGLLWGSVDGWPQQPKEWKLLAEVPDSDDARTALRDLRDACTDAYKDGRIPAEPFVRAGNVLTGGT